MKIMRVIVASFVALFFLPNLASAESFQVPLLEICKPGHVNCRFLTGKEIVKQFQALPLPDKFYMKLTTDYSVYQPATPRKDPAFVLWFGYDPSPTASIFCFVLTLESRKSYSTLTIKTIPLGNDSKCKRVKDNLNTVINAFLLKLLLQ